MMRQMSRIATVACLLAATSAGAVPVDSDLAAAPLGGGCYPTGIQPALLDMLTLVNPEWAPIVNGMIVDSTPVLAHGIVEEMHGDTSGDFPATHLRADVNAFIRLDPADEGLLATGNGDGRLHLEWEAGVYPAWAWPGPGDRMVALGRWIFDCGHPDPQPGNCSFTTARQCVIDGDCQPPICAGCLVTETCLGEHFGYSAELHQPHATAVIRSGRGGVLSRKPGVLPGRRPVVVTKADVYVSREGGGAGDRCVITHRPLSSDQLTIECFPLDEPVAALNAQDFTFNLPLPPRPSNGHVRRRLIVYPAPGGRPARVRVRRRVKDPEPHLEVTVYMTRLVPGGLPTGFAGTILAGWKEDHTPVTHVRTTVTAVVINNALQPAVPVAPKTCSGSNTPCASTAECPSGQQCLGAGPVKAWQLQASVNGEWGELTGLGSVDTGNVIPQTTVFDQYLTADGAVHVVANGVARECVDTLYGQSLATSLLQFGFSKGLACLNSTAHPAGTIDVSYPGPDFGTGGAAMDYETASVGGQGGHCSVMTGLVCLVDADCPSGETCVPTGGAFALRYRIELVP